MPWKGLEPMERLQREALVSPHRCSVGTPGDSHPECPAGFQRLPPDSRGSHQIPRGTSWSKGGPGISTATFHTHFFHLQSPGASHSHPAFPKHPWTFYISLNAVGMWQHSQFYPKGVELVIPAPSYLWVFYTCLEMNSPDDTETVSSSSQTHRTGDSCPKSPLDILHFPGDSRNAPDVSKLCSLSQTHRTGDPCVSLEVMGMLHMG